MTGVDPLYPSFLFHTKQRFVKKLDSPIGV